MKTLLLGAPLLLALTSLSAQPIRIVGSDLLAPVLAETFESFAGAEGAPELDLAMDGSSDGRRDLDNGEADLAILAIPDDREKPEGYELAPLTFKTVLIVVNASNPVDALSLQELRRIYSVRGGAVMESWSELTDVPSWSTRNIDAYAIRQRSDLALELFSYAALDGARTRPSVLIRETPRELIETVSDNSAAIAVVPYLPLPERVKVLSIKDAEGSSELAYSPSRDNILFGDYPLRLPFYLVYRAEDAVRLRPLLLALLSDETAAKLERSYFMAAPQSERRDRSLLLQAK